MYFISNLFSNIFFIITLLKTYIYNQLTINIKFYILLKVFKIKFIINILLYKLLNM